MIAGTDPKLCKYGGMQGYGPRVLLHAKRDNTDYYFSVAWLVSVIDWEQCNELYFEEEVGSEGLVCGVG